MSGERPTYGNWRRPPTAGLFDLGTWGTRILGVGLVVSMMTLSFSLVAGLVMFGLLGVGMLPFLYRDRAGRTGYEQVAEWIIWKDGQRRGRHEFRSGPLSRVPGGHFRVPGLGAGIEMLDAIDAHGHHFALLHHRRSGHAAVVLECQPPGLQLVDPGDVDAMVGGWGVWLNRIAQEPGLEHAAVHVETAPDPGHRLRQAVEGQMTGQGPKFAVQVLEESMETFAAGSAQISVRITLTWAMRLGGRKRTINDMAVEIGSRLPELASSLSSAGGGASRALNPAEVASAVRLAFDPARALQAAPPPVGWDDAGPSSAEALRDLYRHDSAVSINWQMVQAPKGAVTHNVLRRLLQPDREVERKRVTLLYRPFTPAEAADQVDDDVRDAHFQATQRKRRRARDNVSVASAEQAAREEALGAGLLRFGMVVTATVPDEEEVIRRAVTVIEQSAAASRIDLRLARYTQDSTFLMGLPLGLIPVAHVRSPGAGLQ